MQMNEKGAGKMPQADSRKNDLFRYLGMPIVHALLIVVAGALVYSNTFHVPFFLSADYVTENPFVRDISFPLERLKQLNQDYYGLTKSRYLPYLTFALNYKLHGFEVFGYHLVNLIFHLLNALLVYALVFRTGMTSLLERSPLREKRHWLALSVALLFALHPIQTEAVTWIWHGRAAVLTTFFYLAALVGYLSGRLEEGRGKKVYLYYGIAVLSTALAMKCKQNAITLPFMVALYEFTFFQGEWKPRVIRLAPIALTLLIIPATYLLDMGFSLDQASKAYLPVTGQEMTRLDYLFTQFRVLTNYLRLFFMPVGLTAFREWAVSRSLFDAAVLLSGTFVVALFSAGFYLLIRFRRLKPEWSLIGFGIVWFFLAHAVESSIIPLSVLTADYRNYLPAVGVFIAVSTAITLLALRFDRSGAPIISLFFGVLLIVLAVSAYSRNRVWRTELSLAQDVVENAPDSAQAHFILSKAYKSQGKLAEANQEVDTAFKLDAAAHPDMLSSGRKQTAPGTGAALKKLAPGEVGAHFKLAVELYGKKQMDTALNELRAVLAADANHADAHYFTALILHEQGMNEEASREYQSALKLKPDFVAAYSDYAALLAQMGKFPEAIIQLQLALQRHPEYSPAHRFLGMIYQDTGRLPEAVSAFKAAIKLHPDYADAHNNLGEAYLQLGDMKGAAAEFRTAIRLKPDFEMAKKNLAKITRR